ncbi:MAG: exosortase-associated EpsI family protein [Opitutus sp.]|nr:exosortase-associated EpsI family protein [Opitutus sp.]
MSNPAAKHHRSRSQLAAAWVCAVAAAGLFHWFGNAAQGYVKTTSLFWWWISQWIDPNAETEHGWLILGLSAWLLWRNLRMAEGRTPMGDGQAPRSAIGHWPSAIAMGVGLAWHAVGFAGQQGRVSIVALLVFAWGVLRLGGGRRWGAAAVFPLGFLFFAIPLNVFDSVGFWLRLWVIKASAGLAHTAGIGVIQNGTQLLAADGRYNYDVAAACSGVRSLMALAALALLTGYLNFSTWWRRGAVLLLCFPLVYLGNVARIASIVFTAHWGGQAWGERAHTVMGYGVFGIVLGGVLAGVAALARWWPEAAPKSAGPEPGCHPLGDQRVWAVAAAIVGLAVGEMFFLHHLTTRPPHGAVGVRLMADGKNPVELPAILDREWVGWPAAVTAIEREILPPDTGFSRMDYRSSRDARQVLLSIVLSGRDRTSIHRPELCLVGQGWTITDAVETNFRFPGRAGAAPERADRFPATLLRVRREMTTPAAAGRPGGREAVPQLVAYWFVSSELVVATHWQRFIHDAWNRLRHARADRWAYVLMQTDATDGEAAALARMQVVLDATLPVFQLPMKNS